MPAATDTPVRYRGFTCYQESNPLLRFRVARHLHKTGYSRTRMLCHIPAAIHGNGLSGHAAVHGEHDRDQRDVVH
jgi:hypothetical protein